MTKIDTYTTPAGNIRTIVHGTPGGYRNGCRCPECKEAERERTREAKRKRLARPTPGHVHGTWNGYANYGCRCPECLVACQQRYPDAQAYREANRDALNEKRRKYYKESGK